MFHIPWPPPQLGQLLDQIFARLPVLALLVGLSLPFLAGCPGALGGSGWPTPTGTGGSTGAGTGGASGEVCDAPTKYFKATTGSGCSTAGICHDNAFAPEFKATADPWTVLMGKNATQGTGCIGQPLVNPAKPAGGALIKRLMGSECGASMPYNMPLDPVALECITSWVNSKLP